MFDQIGSSEVEVKDRINEIISKEINHPDVVLKEFEENYESLHSKFTPHWK